MADLQSQFEKFHQAIKLDDENEYLREKRDILIEKLKKRLSEEYTTLPQFTHFNKGSYAMDLGVVPIDGDYDIDVGLEFDINKEDYKDPVEVKKWVYLALYGHTDEIKIKRPCITVQYHLNDEPIYHVDFAVYANSHSTNALYLARGKETSPEEERIWAYDDPKGLVSLIRSKFSDENDQAQFRRIIRATKRWKNLKFSTTGHEAPTGVGITVAAYYWFTPNRKINDAVSLKYKYSDLESFLDFVERMRQNFTPVLFNGENSERLVVALPLLPNNDLFEKMTNTQMNNFKEKLEQLCDSLKSAIAEADPVEASKIIIGQLGDDFPIPEAKDTAQKRGPAIISSSSAA
jgi:hypothetical protein